MQKFVLLGVLLLGIVLFFSRRANTEAIPNREKKAVVRPSEAANAKKSQKNIEEINKSVFVPYWNLQNLDSASEYDTLIYFGISITEDGVNYEDQGFANMQNFVENTPNSAKYLTLRMLNTDTNLEVLESKNLQQKIITEVIAISKENGFSGVVLDLELSVIPFSNVTNDINTFVKNFSDEVKSEDLHFAVALYGDTYYRGRPYDVKTISSYSDEILIMAYDFHKSRGEPGPNFPLNGKKTYGYDYQQMIVDFSEDVPSEKLTVIFGMYGYDWTLGSEGLPLKGATSFSLADAQGGFVPTCTYTSCKVIRDSESEEMKVTYIDEEDYRHTVWFEDEESVEKKTEYLKEQGIGSISYWTWGYW